MQKNKKAWLAGVLIVGALLNVSGCAEKEEPPVTDGTEAQILTETQPLSEIPAEKMEIETPYGTLYYPAEHQSDLNVVQEDVNESYYVRFMTNMENTEQILFELVFSGESGELLGSLGTTNVYLNVFDLQMEDSWSEESKNKIYAMQEGLNSVVESIQAMENYSSEAAFAE